MRIISVFSPNYNKKKRSKISIKLIIIHYTGMQSERESIKRLCNPKHKVSCHYLINRSGKIFQLVNDFYIAWHAGKSCWGKYNNLNKNSLGIELVNKGHQYGYTNFTTRQLQSLTKLCKILIKKYKVKKNYIIGHSDVAPLRKLDPGEKFPWKNLHKNKIGIWHNFDKKFLKKNRKKKLSITYKKRFFLKNLSVIGYCLPTKKKLYLKKIIKAFQRHFRPELINGVIDEETFVIAQNLAKKAVKKT